jgi:hypothetical protein
MQAPDWLRVPTSWTDRSIGIMDMTREVFDIYNVYGTQDMCLELAWYMDLGDWISTSQGMQWRPEAAQRFDILDKAWDGRFRKVKITLVSHLKGGIALSEMIKLAEICAPRLVGDSGRAKTWEEETELVQQFGIKWQRSLTIERKV